MTKKITADQIRKLREESGAPVLRAKKVLEETKGDEKKALEILLKEGFEKMEKRTERATAEGIVQTYSHHTGKVASMVELLCETDFVGRNDVFKDLAANIALQIASMNPLDEKDLLSQPFIKDPSKKIEDLVNEAKTKTGENIRLGRFCRLEIGA